MAVAVAVVGLQQPLQPIKSIDFWEFEGESGYLKIADWSTMQLDGPVDLCRMQKEVTTEEENCPYIPVSRSV